MSISRRLRSAVLLPATAWLFFWALPLRADKSYSIPNLEISAHLFPDGSMRVDEKRTFDFSGSFHFAFRELPLNGPVRFENFAIEENGVPYRASSTEEPGTFRLTDKGDFVEVRWFYDAVDQRRTFTFSYTVQQAVQRYEDAAVLYYQFISKEWEKEQENVAVYVYPPQPTDSVQAWLHAPLWAEYKLDETGRIYAWSRSAPGRSIFEVRALYPPSLFAQVPERGGLKRAGVLSEEENWVKEANAERQRRAAAAAKKVERREQGKLPAIVISLLGFAAWWKLYQIHGKRPVVPTLPKISPELPDKTPLALVGYLLNSKQISGAALFTTLMDLARRGFARMQEERQQKKKLFGGETTKTVYVWYVERSFWREHESDLLPFEQKLLDFLFNTLTDGGDSLEVEGLQKESSRLTKFYSKWSKEIEAFGDAQGWYDKESSRGMVKSVGVSGLLLLSAIGVALYFGHWAVVIAAATLIVFILSFSIAHRTYEGELLAQRWLSFKRYLAGRNFTASAAMARSFDMYLIYGLAIGMPSRFVKDLCAVMPTQDNGGYVPWYHGHGGHFSPEAFQQSFTAMVNATNTAMSTAAGTGGGASGGGGGGAGSGGGGAG